MPIEDLFGEEDAIISVASEIVKNLSFSDNPLFAHFSRLFSSYAKLNKQQKRIIRLSDKQHHKLSVVNREMRHILDNIPVGIIIVDKELKIQPSYSYYIHRLFKDKQKIAGITIDKLLFWEDDREKEREALLSWLDLVFDIAFEWELIGELGPDMIEHHDGEGLFYHNISYHRIIHDDGELYLMVYITDITETVMHEAALKEQEIAHNFELEIFSFVVNQENCDDVNDYIDNTERMIRESHELYNVLAVSEDRAPLYNHMFRLMHSVKGLSRTFGINGLAEIAHQAENILNGYRSNEISFETGLFEGTLASETLLKILNRMEELLKNGENILQRIFNQTRENKASIRCRRRGIPVEREKIRTVFESLEKIKDTFKDQHTAFEQIDAISEQVFRMTLQPVDVVYRRLHKIVKDVARSLGKEAELSIEGDSLLLDPEGHYLIINALIHILRNSLDHGIETPEKRSLVGKKTTGRISIITSVKSERLGIKIVDDGAGIDPSYICAKAVNKGFIKDETANSMSDEEKTALILLPGFSCMESVSDISGRGVGMDVVAEAMKSLGGTLSISSVKDKGTTIEIDFPSPEKKRFIIN